MKINKSPFIWGNVQFIGEMSLDWSAPAVYRYMPFERVCSMLKDHEIAFVSPELWEDPYEKRFYNVKVIKDEGAKHKGYISFPKMACLCFTSSSTGNSEAFWSRSKTSKEPYACVKFDLYGLLSELNGFVKGNARIYVSAVKYEAQNIIRGIHNKWKFYEESLERSYVRLMSLKRNAFSYERELRIFIVWDNDSKKTRDFNEKNIVFVPLKKTLKNLIKHITLDPRLELFENADKIQNVKKKSKESKSEYQRRLEQILKDAKLNLKPDVSGLYSANKCREIVLSKRMKKR